MPFCTNDTCYRELSLGALLCDYCQTPGRSAGTEPDAWAVGIRLVGTTIRGRYKLHSVLRADEAGLLYGAKRLDDGEDVAVRLLPREVASSPDKMRELAIAAAAGRGLIHTNIVPCLGLETEDPELPCLIYPRVDGESVAGYQHRRALERRARGLPPEESLLLLEGIADGLDALHRFGAVHRDLRPATIVLVHDGDRIVPRLVDAMTSYVMRTVLRRLGRPEFFPFPYTPPEAIRGEAVGRSGDLFALGCLAWEMLLGIVPFPGPDRSQRILSGAPDRVNLLDDGIQEVFLRAMDPDPKARFASARPFVEALSRALPRDAMRASTRTMSSGRVLPRSAVTEVPPTLRRPSGWAGIGGLLTLVGLLVAYGAWGLPARSWARTAPLAFVRRVEGFLAGRPPRSRTPSRPTTGVNLEWPADRRAAAAPAVPTTAPDSLIATLSGIFGARNPGPAVDIHGSPGPVEPRAAGSSPTTSSAASPATPLTSSTAPVPSLVPLGKNAGGHEEYLNSVDESRMVLIPAGAFWMGSDAQPGEGPAHEVWLSSFLIDKTEVTAGQYRRYLKAIGRDVGPALVALETDQPMGGLSWLEAAAYMSWAGKTLPSEAQWEKAARGGVASASYPWGEELPDTTRSWFGQAREASRPRPVGSTVPNGFGLHDMAGNLWEWCLDSFLADAYETLTPRNPVPIPQGPYKVIRGGSFTDRASQIRVSARNRLRATMSGLRTVGARGVRPVPSKSP